MFVFKLSISENRLLVCSVFGNEGHIIVLKSRGFDLLVGSVFVKFNFETSGRCVPSISENRLLACSQLGNERHIIVLKWRGFDFRLGVDL